MQRHVARDALAIRGCLIDVRPDDLSDTDGDIDLRAGVSRVAARRGDGY
jgi:hypothetical protein